MPSIIPSIPRPLGSYTFTGPKLIATSVVFDENSVIFGNSFVEATSNYTNFTNKGMIWIDNESAFITMYGGNFLNTGTMVSDCPDTQANTVSFISRFMSFHNSGTILAKSIAGASIALNDYTGWHSLGDETIYNSGVIAAQGPGTARAIDRYNGGPIVNEAGGAILAEGAQAIAVTIRGGDTMVDPGEIGPVSFYNAGRIEATSINGGWSFGVSFQSDSDEWFHLVNDGLIKADTAISFHSIRDNSETLENRQSGSIVGQIFLGRGSDLFENEGSVLGKVDLGDGDDRLLGAAGIIDGKIYAGLGNDTIHSGRGDDEIYGGAGSDFINGGAGADVMAGGGGSDTYAVDNVGDIITEALNRGHDRVQISLSSYTLAVNVEDGQLLVGAWKVTGNDLGNTLRGNGGDNALFGQDGDDVLFGFAGADRIVGGAGDDQIRGGHGRDTVSGGTGADIFIFGKGEFSGVAPSTADRITDFSAEQGDQIDLSALVSGVTGNGSALSFIGTAAFDGEAGQLHYRMASDTCIIEGDLNGDGAADFALVLVNAGPLDVGCLIL